MTTASYTCACCGQDHDGLPAVTFAAPWHWAPEMAGRRRCWLTSDLCIIDRRDFFVRAVLRLPVVDGDVPFEWGVWVSQSEANVRRLRRPWNAARQHRLAPTFGWLSNELPGYEPTTLNLKTMLIHQRPGLRPLVALEPTDHPLAVEYREGITTARAHHLAAVAA